MKGVNKGGANINYIWFVLKFSYEKVLPKIYGMQIKPI